MTIVRFLKLKYIALRYGIDDLLFQAGLLRNLRFLRFTNPFLLVYRKQSRGERLRLALEKAGPLYIKFGQVLSTRVDTFPEDILQELNKLRDKVPPFSGKQAKAIAEKEFNQPLAKIFKSFDENALASASIAQVHAATLLDGEEVVVKILRPKIKKQIKKDLAFLKTGARIVQSLRKSSRNLKPLAMIEEVEAFLKDEVNLTIEASNAEKIKKNMCGNDWVYVPDIHQDLCKPNIMVMERIYGIPIYNHQELKKHDIDVNQLAEKALDIFLTQIFRDRFFHADLHPGNLFVDHTTLSHPRLVLVDFGIAGFLNESDQRYIAKNILAFLDRDYHQVAKLHIECGWVPSTVNVDVLEAAFRNVSEPVLNKPLNEISFGNLVLKLLQTAKQFEMNIQPQLLLLQKTLLNIEGLCRSLSPEMNLWEKMKPIVKHWLNQQIGPCAFLKKMKDNLPYWLEYGPELPKMLNELMLEKKSKQVTNHQDHSHKTIVVLLFIVIILLLINLF